MRLSFGVLVFRADHPDIEPDSRWQTGTPMAVTTRAK